jgi:integrase
MSKKKDKTLRKVLNLYDRDKELAPDYVGTMRSSIKRFEKFLGRKARVSDITCKNLNRWMQFEQQEGRLADRTRSNGLTNLLTLSKYLRIKLDLSRIRRVKVRPKNPAAWDEDELCIVADAMTQLNGVLKNGVPRSLYFSTVVWFAYETGLRRRDIWDFQMDWFTGKSATLSQHKTQKMHIVAVTEETMADLRKIQGILEAKGSSSETPLKWPQSQSQFYYWFRKARKLAGVDPNVVNRVLQHLRRTGATAVEQSGGKAFQYLGHTKEGLDRKSYVDRLKTAKATSPACVRRPAARLKVA